MSSNRICCPKLVRLLVPKSRSLLTATMRLFPFPVRVTWHRMVVGSWGSLGMVCDGMGHNGVT